MENKKIYNDDVERIVNNPNRQKWIARKYSNAEYRKNTRLMNKIIIFTILGALFLFADLAECVTTWIACPAAVICEMIAMFHFGKLSAICKIKGWN